MTKKEAIVEAFKILEEAFPGRTTFDYRIIGSLVVGLSPSDARSYSVVQQTIYTINMVLNKSPQLFQRVKKGFYRRVQDGQKEI